MEEVSLCRGAEDCGIEDCIQKVASGVEGLELSKGGSQKKRGRDTFISSSHVEGGKGDERYVWQKVTSPPSIYDLPVHICYPRYDPENYLAKKWTCFLPGCSADAFLKEGSLFCFEHKFGMLDYGDELTSNVQSKTAFSGGSQEDLFPCLTCKCIRPLRLFWKKSFEHCLGCVRVACDLCGSNGIASEMVCYSSKNFVHSTCIHVPKV